MLCFLVRKLWKIVNHASLWALQHSNFQCNHTRAPPSYPKTAVLPIGRLRWTTDSRPVSSGLLVVQWRAVQGPQTARNTEVVSQSSRSACPRPGEEDKGGDSLVLKQDRRSWRLPVRARQPSTAINYWPEKLANETHTITVLSWIQENRAKRLC